MKYCCVYLPDGTASLASVRPGLSIRDMLAGICEKRGFSPSDIKVYLVGNEQVWGKGAPASEPGVARTYLCREHHDTLAFAESTGVGPGVLCAGRPEVKLFTFKGSPSSELKLDSNPMQCKVKILHRNKHLLTHHE